MAWDSERSVSCCFLPQMPGKIKKWGFSDAVTWCPLDVLMGHSCCTAVPAARDTIICADLSISPQIRWHRGRQGTVGFPVMNHAGLTFDP